MRLSVLPLLVVVTTLACSGDPKFILEKRPIAEVPHQGFRRDIPDERRGNASFFKAVFTREGNYLVTFVPDIRVWDPRTGALLHSFPANLSGNDILAVDGTHHRILVRRGDVAPNLPAAWGLGVRDLRDGAVIGVIPETDRERANPVGFTERGEPIVFRERRIEVWEADLSGVRTTIAPPAGKRFCEGGTVAGGSTYTDKQCFELSPSRRWLAVTARDTDDHTAPEMPYLVDLERGEWTPIEMPDEVGRRARGFAFSSDERTLAVGVDEGMWIWRPSLASQDRLEFRGAVSLGADHDADRAGEDREAASITDHRSGPFIRGEHQRGLFLTPMAMTANDTRVVALGDQLTVATYDVATGELIGRVAPPFEDWAGAFRVSADGSRVVVYRFIADILVVIDGTTGTQRGYVCPYFCNRAHNPVEVPYAVSPDGRRIASGGRLGAGLWDADADTLIAPLEDPKLPPRRPR